MSKEYRIIKAPKKVADWKGLLVRSKGENSTMLAKFRAGTIFRITSSGLTKYLETLPCECCGLVAKMTVGGSAEQFLKKFDFVEIAEQLTAQHN